MSWRQVCACGEFRKKAVKDGVCACCAAPKNTARIAKCPMCPRENAPFDRHHPFGRRAQEILGNGEMTVDVCKNCHRVVTAFLDPFMKAQQKFLSDEVTTDNRAAAFFLACVTAFGHVAKFEQEEDQFAKDLRDNMQRFVKYGNR